MTLLERGEVLALEFDAIAIGHGTPGLIFDAKHKVRQAREHFGYILDPWYTLSPALTTQ